MNPVYLHDLIVRIRTGNKIHARDVDGLLDLLESIEQAGGLDEATETANQTGYEQGRQDEREDWALWAENLVYSYERKEIETVDLIAKLRAGL